MCVMPYNTWYVEIYEISKVKYFISENKFLFRFRRVIIKIWNCFKIRSLMTIVECSFLNQNRKLEETNE